MSGAQADDAGGVRRSDLVIRFAGEAGEGIKSPGELIIQAAARAGYRIITDFSPPAEIKGGVSFFQIRLSTHPIYTRGDSPDVLLAFNQEAYDAYIADLRDGGMLIYDPDRVTLDPDQVSHFQTLAFPMGSIAAKELRMPIVKNVVAVGGLATLFGLETDHLKQVIRKLWLRKGEAVVETNYKALDAGITYVHEQVNGAAPFVLAPAEELQNTIHVSGNQATGLGAIAGGVQFFAGYPITPASDVMEYLAAWLPQQGGHVVQAEDEIAAVNMLLGASYAGARAMTTTSGPRPLVDGRGAGAGDDGRVTRRHRGRAARRAFDRYAYSPRASRPQPHRARWARRGPPHRAGGYLGRGLLLACYRGIQPQREIPNARHPDDRYRRRGPHGEY